MKVEEKVAVLDEEDGDDTPKRNDDGTTTIVLTTPITHGEEEIRELRVRAPTARDLESTDAVQGDMKKANALLAHLTGLSLAAVRKLSAADVVRAQKVVAVYMGKSQ